MIAQARRWQTTPARLIGLDGWAAFLWDEALDWFERYDAQKTAPAPRDDVFGAYG